VLLQSFNINENRIKGTTTGLHPGCISLLCNGVTLSTSMARTSCEMTRTRLMNAKRISGRVCLYMPQLVLTSVELKRQFFT